MSLAAGTRLGPYEVIAKLGEGGMGEVYRAIDTDLKRAVAIKVLPEQLRRDPDRLARFQREAEILAALNHPPEDGAVLRQNRWDAGRDACSGEHDNVAPGTAVELFRGQKTDALKTFPSPPVPAEAVLET